MKTGQESAKKGWISVESNVPKGCQNSDKRPLGFPFLKQIKYKKLREEKIHIKKAPNIRL
jgi:hypothetical protein